MLFLRYFCWLQDSLGGNSRTVMIGEYADAQRHAFADAFVNVYFESLCVQLIRIYHNVLYSLCQAPLSEPFDSISFLNPRTQKI